MSASVVIIFLLSSTAGLLAGQSPLIVPCKRNDEACMVKSTNLAAAMIIPGIPSLNVDSLEVIRIEEVSGKSGELFVNYTNNVLEEYTKCSVSDVKLNLDAWKLKFHVTCPALILTGHLVVSGKLLDVPVDGNGDFKMITGKFLSEIDTNVEKVTSDGGVNHLAITNYYEIREVPVDPFKFEFDGLKPKIQLTSAALDDFERDKYLKLVEMVAPPYTKKLHAIIFKSVNKFLENIPFDDLFID